MVIGRYASQPRTIRGRHANEQRHKAKRGPKPLYPPRRGTPRPARNSCLPWISIHRGRVHWFFRRKIFPTCCTSKETEKRNNTLALLLFKPNCGERKMAGPRGMPKLTVGPRYCDVAFQPNPSVVPNPP